MNVKAGCMTRPWAKYSFERALEGIARAGYVYTAYVGQHGGRPAYTLESRSSELAALRSKVESFGLKAVAAWAGDPLNYGVEGMRRHVEMAGELGLEYLILSSPYAKQRRSPELPIGDEFISIVEPVLERADALGVSLHVKPHMGEHGTGPGLAALAKKVGHPRFGVSYDPGNIHYYEGLRADEDVKRVADQVRSVCVKDHRGAQRENNFPTPGDGDVRWEPIWQSLSQAGFRGYALVELLGGSEAEEIDREAVKARERLAAWVRGAGGVLEDGAP